MSARLSQLLRADLDTDPVILGVTADSRQVRPGFLFAALPGAKVDGRAFMRPAVDAGAAAILAGEAHPELARARGRRLGRAPRLRPGRRRLLRRPAPDRGRRHRHQRQDLGRRLLPPDLRQLGP
ncbi:MAG: Mur ligase domain-containing protein [Caulobacteraceae bacterium]